ncbi:putative C2H2-type domain-containing protein [Seiridium cardinale]
MVDKSQHRLQCSICHRSFSRTEHLTRHERSHRNEKPFSCDYCDARFTRKDLIKTHTVRHHPHLIGRPKQGPGGRPGVSSCQADAAPPVPETLLMPAQIPVSWVSMVSEDPDALDFHLDTFLTGDAGTAFDPRGDHDTAFAAVDLGQRSYDEGPSAMLFPGEESSPLSQLGLPEKSFGAFDVSVSKRSELERAGRVMGELVEADFIMPSCAALQRYIAAFFDGLLVATPCIHGPTWKSSEQEPALLLATAALGAALCNKVQVSLDLHRAAQRCMWNHLRSSHFNTSDQPVWVAQALLFIMQFGTWSGEPKTLQESLAFQSILASIVRSIKTPQEPWTPRSHDSSLTWSEWIENEIQVRTKLATFVYFGQLNIAFNLPYPLVNSEVDTCLPSSEEEWYASSPGSWEQYRKQMPSQPAHFVEALEFLIGNGQSEPSQCGAFATLVMFHAILQHIWNVRECSLGNMTPDHIRSAEMAIIKWERLWARAMRSSASTFRETTVTPILDGYALLKSTIFRLYAGLSRPKPGLLSFDMNTIINVMRTHVQSVTRSAQTAKAAIYGIEAIQVPFKVDYSWSNRVSTGACSLHFLCLPSLHCCLFLSQWLQLICSADVTSLTSNELQALSLVESALNDLNSGAHDLHRPLHIRVLYAWCGIFSDAGPWGYAPVFLSAVHQYAQDLEGKGCALS